MESKSEAFEMWAYRSMLRVSWTEHNDEVLKMAAYNKLLLSTIKNRKCQYFGHLIRARLKKNCYWKEKLKGREDGGDQELPE